jgi:hypothetical protein
MSWVAVAAFVLAALGHRSPFGEANTPPVAEAGANASVACEIEGAAAVALDGTASKDVDSTPGTSDDIVQYQWTEDGTFLADGDKPSVHFPVGSHIVTLTVTDAAGAQSSDDVSVIVYDDIPPLIACPKDVTVECTDSQTQVDLGRASAKDTCFATASVVNDRTDGGENASGLYPAGETIVTFTATDAVGWTATCQTLVSVTSADSPRLVVQAVPSVLTPANHALRRIAVNVNATGACGAPLTVTLLSVTSSEPDDAPGGGDGATVDDIRGAAIGTEDAEIFLRAERAGSGPGRVYTLRYAATDAAGNEVQATTTVVVPH